MIKIFHFRVTDREVHAQGQVHVFRFRTHQDRLACAKIAKWEDVAVNQLLDAVCFQHSGRLLQALQRQI